MWARDLRMLLGLVAAEVDVASLALAPESTAAAKAVGAAVEAANAAATSSVAEDRPTDAAEERR